MVLRSDSRLIQVVFSICRLLQEVRAGRLQDHPDHPEDRALNPSPLSVIELAVVWLQGFWDFFSVEKLKKLFFLYMFWQKCFFLKNLFVKTPW